MAPERRLIPQDDDSSSSSSSSLRVRCTSNVVGVIPPKVHDVLARYYANDYHDHDDVPRPHPPRGRVDDRSSGASYVLVGGRGGGRGGGGYGGGGMNNDDSVVVVWEHATQTSNEDLVAPISGLYARIAHPEHRPLVVDDRDDRRPWTRMRGNDLLVTILGSDGGGGGGRDRRGGRGGGGASSSSPRRAYVASPATGVLCVWVLDDDYACDAGDGTMMECDASVRLRLGDGEHLTAMIPMIDSPTHPSSSYPSSSTTSSSWLLVSTSRGRLWKVYRTSRPSTLHARLVRRADIGRDHPEGGVGGGGGASVGIIRGLYDYLTTPSKRRHSTDGDDRGGGGGVKTLDEGRTDDRGIDEEDDEDIVALIPLPPPTTTIVDPNDEVVGGNRRMSPSRGPAGMPPPRKQQRLPPSSSSSIALPPPPSIARVVSLTSSMALREWIVSTSSDYDDNNGVEGRRREGRTSRYCPFPRRIDGTLDLSALVSPSAMTEGGEDSPLEGYRRLDVIAAPILASDGASIIVVIRIAMDDDDEATRAYVVRIGGLANDDDDDDDGGWEPYVVDAAWLDRYSGPSLSDSVIGGVECAGLAVAEEDEESRDRRGDDDAEIVIGGSVAYVGFGPATGGPGGGDGRPFPVTVSAIHFPTVDIATARRRRDPPRIKDMDLHPDIVPSVVRDSFSYDPLTGGCVFLSTTGLLGGAHVRFPIISRRQQEALSSSSTEGVEKSPKDVLRPASSSLLLLANDEAVLTIKSHLQSSFRLFLSKVKEAGGGGGKHARSVVAPSIGTCPSRVLSAAVVLASNDLACASFGGAGGGGGGGAPFAPRVTSSGCSPVTALRDKLRLHRDFVTFLVHAGAYRRVSTEGKVRLRDHGEMITAMRSLLIECQGYFSKAEAAVGGGDNSKRLELVHARQIVMTALEGASDDVTLLPDKWCGLQQLALSSGISPLLGKDMLLLLTSLSICEGIGQALRYRQNESSSLYDIPSYDSSSYPPWTSSSSVLAVLFAQLRSIQQWIESALSKALHFDTDLRRYVEDLSASVLSGHRDALALDEPNNDVGLKSSYEEAKSLAVYLLRLIATDQKDDLMALQTSLEHSYFEGIVQICHDHRQSWRFIGPFAHQKADERYDLRQIIINSSPDSPYGHLHQTRDHNTGLSFCSYVLRWYADRGFYYEVFELGKHCQHDLTRYVRNDHRLSNLAWIQHLRVGGHELATVGLLDITSPLLFGKESGMSLWEKDQMMSLAKLSNKLAGAKSANRTTAHDQRTKAIENGLTLLSAQRILQEDAELGDEIALDQNDIVRLAVEKIQSSQDVDEIKRFAICGLSVAAAKTPDQIEAMSRDATTIWHAVIQVDIDKWQNVANENSMAVGGMEEEELIHFVEGTAFVGVLYDFVTASGGGEMQNVGFGSHQVRNQLMHELGSEELEKVLTLSADIVLAAN